MLSTTTVRVTGRRSCEFPSLLLLTTLLRLALAIASTKMILIHAHAGAIIDAFGEMVVGGNVAVGLVVFIVLCRDPVHRRREGRGPRGRSGRAFHAGRHSRAPDEHRRRHAQRHGRAAEASKLRAALEHETYFYGSLDGAMKFVKGDAIAGLVVALVNIVGGLTVGIVQRGMSFGDSLHAYTILTVGDGLVSQIPSLIVSIAAGFSSPASLRRERSGRRISAATFTAN